MIPHQSLKLADLDCLHVPATRHNARNICLLHGFGANYYDLLPLSQVLDPKQQFNWYFVNAPLQVQIGPGYYGRAWFSIDMMALQTALMQGRYDFFEYVTPPELVQSSRLLQKALASLSQEKKIILGGFSQGAMLALDVHLHSDALASHLVLFSGTIIAISRWKAALAQASPIEFLQTHGMSDPILPYNQAEKLFALLKGANWKGQFTSFRGQHEIPDAALSSCQTFLASHA